MDQIEFLNEFRKGNRKVVEQIYRMGFHYCASFVKNNTGTQKDAEDLFQEALMVLFRNSQKNDFTLNCDVRTYLYSVVRNLWLKQISGNKKTGLKLLVDDDDEQEYVIVSEDEIEFKKEKEKKHELISQMMGKISEDCKNLLMSYYFLKIPLKDVGDLMGYTSNFVKVKKNRCMEALKEKVKEAIV